MKLAEIRAGAQELHDVSARKPEVWDWSAMPRFGRRAKHENPTMMDFAKMTLLLLDVVEAAKRLDDSWGAHRELLPQGIALTVLDPAFRPTGALGVSEALAALESFQP